ncbi:MAG: undecaprenyl/decaprenyl-phosphate alpha-N-acetylglucosaminyl 1-phosphate transferase [Alphaproteobacteria bacterium]|nr:undecaprenyl/decaprenyl-phosphate alpha-N-acetylglucosaminyl 1-phosphate transferase [Alphaproteobacteria bacterium]
MLPAYLLSGTITLAFCLYAQRIGPLLRVMDSPDGRRKLHAAPTPLVAGIAVMVPAILTVFALAQTSVWAPLYLTISFTSAFFVVLGYVDDRRHIRALVRLIISAVVVGVALWAVPGLTVRVLSFSVSGPFSPIFLGPFFGAAFSILCLVGLQNAANMADGKNGLVMGMSLIWTLLLFAYAPSHLNPLLIVLTISLAVALAFNLAGKVFLGDAGTYGLSVLIGMITLYSYNVGFVTFPADSVALMFLVPVVDTLRLIVARTIKGRSPFSADRDHLHHVLLSMMPWHWALTTYLALVALPSIAARYNVEWTGGLALATLVIYALLVAQKYRAVAVGASGSAST